MIKKLMAAAALCLVLMGCTQAGGALPQSFPSRLSPTKETENDMLRCYPLDGAECRFFTYGEDLLLLYPAGDELYLLKFGGKALALTASIALPDINCTAAISGSLIACYNPTAQEALILDMDLTLLNRVSLPGCTGKPLLSREGDSLYYCTDSALMEAECSSGLHRTLRQTPSSPLTVTAMLEKERLLVCRPRDGGGTEDLCLSTVDGSCQGSTAPLTAAALFGSREYRALKCGFNDCLFLEQSQFPLCPGWQFLTFLPEMNGALIYQREEVKLVIYDLTTGNRIASLSLRGIGVPDCAAGTEDGRIFFHVPGALYQWMPRLDPQQDFKVKITSVYTAEQPDQKGLEQCRQRAAFIEEQYGIQILLNTEATQVQPKFCTVEPEYIPSMITDALDRIEKTLGRFPASFVRTAVQGRTYLCPVRQIRSGGKQEYYAQFWSGRDCYILIAVSDQVEESVIRSLSPLADRLVLMNNDAYDTWQTYNPAEFQYGMEDARFSDSFADLRSMRSPAEDRAGILYAAMSGGNRELFLDAILQRKLRQVCVGIRAAFPLEQAGKLPWEQYLWEPV